MTGQDAESAHATLPTAQNNMNLKTFNRKPHTHQTIMNPSPAPPTNPTTQNGQTQGSAPTRMEHSSSAYGA